MNLNQSVNERSFLDSFPPNLIVCEDPKGISEDDLNTQKPQNAERKTSVTANPNYLKRRRTAVFGLSPTTGVNIGAVM